MRLVLMTTEVVFLKKNQNTPRPSEHPPVMGGKMLYCTRCMTTVEEYIWVQTIGPSIIATKFDFTVDEGKEWLNPSREKN